MSAVVNARRLGKRYGRRWALSECALEIPSGHVVGLVGPNGAGGHTPSDDPVQLARIGFVAQDTPTYARLSVADHLAMGAHLNPGWDAAMARDRIEAIDALPLLTNGKIDVSGLAFAPGRSALWDQRL